MSEAIGDPKIVDDVIAVRSRAMAEGEGSKKIDCVLIIKMLEEKKDKRETVSAELLAGKYRDRITKIIVENHDNEKLVGIGESITGNTMVFVVSRSDGFDSIRSPRELTRLIKSMSFQNIFLISLVMCSAGADQEDGYAAEFCNDMKSEKLTPYISARRSFVCVDLHGHIRTQDMAGVRATGRPISNIMPIKGDDGKTVDRKMWKHNHALKTVWKVNDANETETITGFTTEKGATLTAAGTTVSIPGGGPGRKRRDSDS